MRSLSLPLLTGLILLSGYSVITHAEALTDLTLTIKDHKFIPSLLTAPAGKKIKLWVNNQDATAEEFESYSLNREKVIPGNSQGKIFIGPLQPGTYDFFGDFHKATAAGKIVAK